MGLVLARLAGAFFTAGFGLGFSPGEVVGVLPFLGGEGKEASSCCWCCCCCSCCGCCCFAPAVARPFLFLGGEVEGGGSSVASCCWCT